MTTMIILKSHEIVRSWGSFGLLDPLLRVQAGRMVLLDAFIKKTQKNTTGGERAGFEKKAGNRMKRKARSGSSFDDFLKEDSIYEEVTARHQARHRPST